jgi:hypothetical protein
MKGLKNEYLGVVPVLVGRDFVVVFIRNVKKKNE